MMDSKMVALPPHDFYQIGEFCLESEDEVITQIIITPKDFIDKKG